MKNRIRCCCLIFVPVLLFYCQVSAKSVKSDSTQSMAESKEPLSTTQHSITVNKVQLRYTAIAGRLPIGDSAEKPDAYLFFTAYVLQQSNTSNRRPLTFVFNGGPGGSSVWLHLGAAGPRCVPLGKNGVTLPATDTLIDNIKTWLLFTDLVFIDPVGTGYSRAAAGVNASKFYSVDGDIRSIADFIRVFLGRFSRRQSPLFIAGESYGTTRAAGLSNYLQNNYVIVIKGLILLSSALDFQVFSFDSNSDLPFALIIPSYTSVAWYHKHLGSIQMQKQLTDVVVAAQNWVISEYISALYQGVKINGMQRKRIADSLAFYTGLPLSLLLEKNLRIDLLTFVQKLLADNDSSIGILDGRITGLNFSEGSNLPYKDPSLFIVSAPYATMIHDYLQHDLGYQTSLEYVYLSDQINREWKWSTSGEQGYLSVAQKLRMTMSINSQLKVFAGMGYYDLTTPFLSQQYVFEHMGGDSSLLERITVRQYQTGHQIYSSDSGRAALTIDLQTFFDKYR